MITHYLHTAFRNLWSNKLYSCINLLGLAIGLAGTLLISLFVLDELGYDRAYADADRIYRIQRDFYNQSLYLASNAPLVAELLIEDFPEIEHAARLFGGQALVSRDDVAFYESNIRFADNAFFDIFNLQWLAGEPASALTRPMTIVLTESMARKYFGDEAALGQTLLLENQVPMEVTGVIADLPHNTHLDLSVLVSMSTLVPIVGEGFLRDWAGNSFHTYIKLQPGVAIDSLVSQFPAFMERHLSPGVSVNTGMSAIALQDIHLHSARLGEMKPPGSINNVYLFSAIALFVLLIACCNFMNLSTARSSRRGKEVGIRKTLGASRSQIARQFVGESLVLAVLASMLALVMVELALPVFNDFLDKQLTLNFLSDVRIPLLLLGLVLVVGFVAGSYPAFFLSGFKPVAVLRSVLASGSPALRNALVILQFAIAIVLVVATGVVLLQMRYARDLEPGFQREQIVVLSGSPTAGLGQQWLTLREELLRHSEILAAAASGQRPLQINSNGAGVRAEGQEEGSVVPFMRVDAGFFDTYGIELLAGRAFSLDFPADRMDSTGSSNGFILNRLAAEQYGWTPEEAIGKSLSVFTDGAQHAGSVIGVVGNSFFESVRNPLKPMLFVMPPYFSSGEAMMPDASLRLSGRDLAGTLAHIDATWRRFMPEFPVMRRFLDEDFEQLFRGESQQGQLFYWFALLAIFIACMGLYGLASYNAERRIKEIGVRKVMGGSVWNIVTLLTNDFSKLVLLANLLAWPVAYLAMERWLENFAYRIDLTPLVFIGSGLIALCIAWVTVGGTAAKAASQRPVLALRYE